VVSVASAAPQPGKSCKVAGRERVTSAGTLRCTASSGRSLRWVQVAPPPTTTTTTTSSTTTTVAASARAPQVSAVSADDSRVRFTLSGMSPDTGNYAVQWVNKGQSFNTYRMLRVTDKNVSISTAEFACGRPTLTFRVYVMRADWQLADGHQNQNVTPHSEPFDVALTHACPTTTTEPAPLVVDTFAASYGGTPTSAEIGSQVAVDSSGNVYTVGYFDGTTDFDPGSSVRSISSAGANDIFVSKLDSAGAFVWVKRFGSTQDDYGYSVDVDGSGNVYVAGAFRGTVDFDPDSGVTNLTSSGSDDAFIVKLNSSGALLWAKSFGGSGSDAVMSIMFHDRAAPADDFVYLTGDFEGTVDFNPGVGTSNLTSGGGRDSFVSKLDVSGDFGWAKSFSGAGDAAGLDITANNSAVYTTGRFDGTVDFNPDGATNSLTAVGESDVYVSSLDPATGAYVWAVRFGGSENDIGNGIQLDSSGNVYLTGLFRGVVDFDPGVGVDHRTSQGGADVYVSELNSSGVLQWAKTFGGTGSDIGWDLDLDSANNVYIIGGFEGTVDFDPGAGTSNLTAAGVDDVFGSIFTSAGVFSTSLRVGGTGDEGGFGIAVDSSANIYATGYFSDTTTGIFALTSQNAEDAFTFKLNSAGALQWAGQFGTSNRDVGWDIAVDSSGNVYTTGYFHGTVDFDPGSGVTNLVSSGAQDVFVTKMSSSGVLQWAKSFGGTETDEGNSVSVDASGNVYISGWFSATVDFDPGSGTNNLTSAGGFDAFVMKLNTSGAFAWAARFGATADDYSFGLALDSSGNPHTTGWFRGTVDFDPGTGVSNLVSTPFSGGGSSDDAYVLKLSSSGAFVWAKSFGGADNGTGYSVDVDGSGNVYTVGTLYGTVDFDPGAGTSNLTSAGEIDVFVSKLDSSGSFVWAKSFGGTLDDYGYWVGVDGSGNVYTGGSFRGTADFDPGVGTSNLASAGETDMFVSKLDSTGSLAWAKRLGSTGPDIVQTLAVDNSGNVTIAGYFVGTVDFDPNAGTSNLTAVDGYDAFISRWNTSGSLVWVRGIGGTESETVLAVALDSADNVYVTGEYLQTVDFDPGSGTDNLTALSGFDVFVLKLNSSGSRR